MKLPESLRALNPELDARIAHDVHHRRSGTAAKRTGEVWERTVGVALDARAREDEVLRRQAYALKSLAKELGVPVLALAQFNRAGGKSERPTMFDLLGGSGIEQAADNVLILVPEDSDAEIARLSAFVDKRRGGSVEKRGRVVLLDKARQRYLDLSDEFDGWAPSDRGARDARYGVGYSAPGGEAE